MMNYISSNKKKVSKEREKTPARKRREIGGKINITSVFKTEQKSQKKANKSVFSLNSVDFAKEDPKPRQTKNVFSSLESGK